MRTIIISESIYDRLCAILTNYEDSNSGAFEDGEILYEDLTEIVKAIAENPLECPNE